MNYVRQTFTNVTGQKHNRINDQVHFEDDDNEFSRNFSSLPKKGKSTSYKTRGSFKIKDGRDSTK